MQRLRPGAGWPACLLLLACAQAGAALEVGIAYVGERTGSAWSGARQGLEEARLQGEFLGQQYALTDQAAAATAIVAALPTTELLALAARYPDKPVLSIANGDVAARKACRPNLLFLQPDSEMLAAGVRQWQSKHPADEVKASAWHAGFEKYAASQLNHRYAEAFGEPMDDNAWGGWAAVKLLSDTVARLQSAQDRDLLAALRGDVAFDGQKGYELSFRSDGQLRQPVLLSRGENLAGEAPVRGVADSLDSLGTSHCPPAPGT